MGAQTPAVKGTVRGPLLFQITAIRQVADRTCHRIGITHSFNLSLPLLFSLSLIKFSKFIKEREERREGTNS
jgi:hypothetical protein